MMNSDLISKEHTIVGKIPREIIPYQGPPATLLGTGTSLRGDVSSLVRLAVLLSLPFLLADAAFYQLQVLITDGRTPVSAVVFKLVLFFALGLLALIRGRLGNSNYSKATLAFIASLLISALYQYLIVGVDLKDILVSYNTFYLLPIINILALSIPLRIPDKFLLKLLLVLFVICAGLGFLQFIAQRPIVATSSSDQYFQVRIWHNPNGKLKAFSLFLYPERFAAFCSFIACIAVAMFAKRRKLFLAAPLLGLSILACLISTDRTYLVGLVCALTTSVVLLLGTRRGRTKWLPIAYVLFGMLVGAYAYWSSMSGGNDLSLTDTSSFTARLAEWKYFLDVLASAPWTSFVFGFGIAQSERLNTNTNVAIDNIYLATLLHIGVLGSVSLIALLWRLWDELRKHAEAKESYLISGVAAFYSTLWCVGLFTQAVAAATSFLLLFTLCVVQNDA